MAESQIALGFATGAKLWINTALNATKDQIVATTGSIYEVQVDNTANPAAASYVKLYDATSGGVTVGTTDPAWVIKAPGNAVFSWVVPQGNVFGTALTAACVTAAGTGGTTNPTGSVIVRIVYTS